MNIPIVSIIRDSFQEHKDEHSLVLFCYGCDMNCSYCYNRKYVSNKDNIISNNPIEVIKNNITPMHTSITLLGGEFLLYDYTDLLELCSEIRSMGLKIKLYTNGQHPLKLHHLLKLKLIDEVSIDFKTFFDKDILNLKTNTDLNIYIRHVRESLIELSESDAKFEVRTTIYNNMDYREIPMIKMCISRLLGDTNNYLGHILQKEIKSF